MYRLRLRDKAYISEKYRVRRVGPAPAPGTAQRYELPWTDDELYCVYSLGQRFVFFIQASMHAWEPRGVYRSHIRSESCNRGKGYRSLGAIETGVQLGAGVIPIIS